GLALLQRGGEGGAVDAGAVEGEQQDDLLHAVAADAPRTEGLAQRILGQILQEEILAELLPDVHPVPPRAPLCRWGRTSLIHPEWRGVQFSTGPPPRAKRAAPGAPPPNLTSSIGH